MDKRETKPGAFLTPAEKSRVEAAIAAAERVTSGEIRVLISRRVKGDPLAAARKVFHRLGMQRTRERNGVLILLASASRRFVILGDEGIHRAMGQGWWDGIRDGMAARFGGGDFAGGLVHGVEEAGRALAARFPWRPDDTNELPNEVVEE